MNQINTLPEDKKSAIGKIEILKKQLILNCNPTKNKRIYELDVLETIRDQINLNPFTFGCIGIPDDIYRYDINRYYLYHNDLYKIAFNYENAIVENNTLYCDIVIIGTEEGKYILNNLDNIVFRPNGIIENYSELGANQLNNILNLNVRIQKCHNYVLKSISAIDKNTDSLIVGIICSDCGFEMSEAEYKNSLNYIPGICDECYNSLNKPENN